MADDDLTYLLRRAAEEGQAAIVAIGDEARAAHRGLAAAYAERARRSETVSASQSHDTKAR